MVSMKDISRECGVSIATVSKALNDHDDIGSDTKERIRQIAKKMGYLPNSAAQALKTNRTNNLGVLFVDEDNSGLTHDYFAYVLDSFKRTVEAYGYDITFINAGNSRPNRMTYLEHCRYRGFDGVMIACIDFFSPEVIELVQSNIPIVAVDHVFNNTSSILSDNIKGMKDLFDYVYSMGHRKIAYIHGADSAVTQRRVSSFYREAQAKNLDIPDEYVREAAYRDTKGTYEQTLELLQLKNPPTCILYPDDFASFGGVNAIHEMGLRIPEDISIAGYDGIKVGKHIEPQLTTINQDTTLMGERAAEKLIDLIENPRTAFEEQIIIEEKVFKGHSVKQISPEK